MRRPLPKAARSMVAPVAHMTRSWMRSVNLRAVRVPEEKPELQARLGVQGAQLQAPLAQGVGSGAPDSEHAKAGSDDNS